MAINVPYKRLDEDKDLVISLYKQGISLEALATKFDCSTSPIIRILKENNIPRKPIGFQYGKKHWNYKGGRFFNKILGRYIRSINGKKIPEHHFVWIQENQIPILKGCVIHHKNLDKTDNKIENLILLPKDVHDNLHWYIRKNFGG